MANDPGTRGRELVDAARRVEAQSEGGRLPLPDGVSWDVFPFEGKLRMKLLDDVAYPEPARDGAAGVQCRACEGDHSDAVWSDGRWRVSAGRDPEAVLTVILAPLAHVDLPDLDEAEAAELGRHTVRIARALEALPGIERAHVNKWGDGGEHLHVWFFARPSGVLQLRGSTLPDWVDALPPMPAAQWAADLAALGDALGDPIGPAS